MGEVYRARDSRLKRDVAVKVLPASYAKHPDRLRRFEREAEAAGALNHPNITAIYDFGTHDGSPYIATELLEGETLRSRLAEGALPVRKATDYAIQIAKGLSSAHEKGIVHRDLKPENLFVTPDGRVKILDFGLAKLALADEPAGPRTDLRTASMGTEPGVVMGTLGYMSPEQVKGTPADARSDIFALGTILHEMVSGQRTFQRGSAAETMSAILKEDPPDLSSTNRNVPPGLERVVRHCLEKSPEERFQSARDLAFDLEALSADSTLRSGAAAAAAPKRRVRVAPALALLGLVLAGGLGYWLRDRKGVPPPPSFQQLTFRRGSISDARFGSDGESVLYAAAWDGGHREIYQGNPGSPDSRAFGLPGAHLLSVSRSGEVAVALRSDLIGPFTLGGTLARVSATGGGAPREMLEGVLFADWSPKDGEIAIVRNYPGGMRLEFPIGKVLYQTSGWIGDPRFHPDGDRIGFLDHPKRIDDGGLVATVDLGGKKSDLTPLFASLQGLAWSPDGSEVWFTAAEVGSNRSLWTVSPGEKPRLLARVTGSLTLRDVGRDGRALVIHDTERNGVITGSPAGEKDLSWLDASLIADISGDGRAVLFSESGEGGGAGYSVYVRGTDGSPAVRLGEGSARRFSPDGRRVLATVEPATRSRLVVYPIGAGEPAFPPHPGLQAGNAVWLPDGRRVLFDATGPEADAPPRVYLLDTQGGTPRAVSPPGFALIDVARDGRRFVGLGPDRKWYVCAIDGGDPVEIPGLEPRDFVNIWGQDDRSVFVQKGLELPARIVRHDVETGRQEPWHEFLPADATGIRAVYWLRLSSDGRAYAYGYSRRLSTLYLVEGLR